MGKIVVLVTKLVRPRALDIVEVNFIRVFMDRKVVKGDKKIGG